MSRTVLLWTLLILLALLAAASLTWRQFVPQSGPPAVTIVLKAPQDGEPPAPDELEQRLVSIAGPLHDLHTIRYPDGSTTLTATLEKDADRKTISEAFSGEDATVEPSPLRPLAFIALSTPDDEPDAQALTDILSARVRDRIDAIDGVRSTIVLGSPSTIDIRPDPELLAQAGLTLQDITSALREQADGVSEDTSEPTFSFDEPQAFGAIALTVDADGSPVRLDDVADIRVGVLQPSLTLTRQGRSAAGLVVLAQPGANTSKTLQAIRETLAELERTLPEGLTLDIPYEAADRASANRDGNWLFIRIMSFPGEADTYLAGMLAQISAGAREYGGDRVTDVFALQGLDLSCPSPAGGLVAIRMSADPLPRTGPPFTVVLADQLSSLFGNEPSAIAIPPCHGIP